MRLNLFLGDIVANFAIVNNNTVINVIVADTKEIALAATKADDAIETTGQPWTGWVLVDGVWTDPIVEETND